jgi:hypothetical protein
MEGQHLPQPNLRKGLEIFATRPLSLVASLILAVVISVVTFLLLTFPVIAGYYYAVRQSMREEYFIDLNNVFRTNSLVFSGIKRYFVQSYILGITGLIPAVGLLLVPLVPFEIGGEQWKWLSLILQILFLPAFFLAGAVVLYGYPCLIATNNAIGSLRYAISAGKAKLLKVLAVGFILLFPITGFIFHLLMILTYPLIVSWAVVVTADTSESLIEVKGKGEGVLPGMLLSLFLVAVAGGLCYLSVSLWGGPGFVAWLGICLAFALLKVFTTWNFALKLFGFALGFTAAVFGGAVLFTRFWGENIAFVWMGICIVFFLLFRGKIFGKISSNMRRRQ